MDLNQLKAHIRDVPDFPKPGIVFKDITPLLADPQAYRSVLDGLAAACHDLQAQIIAGVESRGFLIAPGLAERLGVGFVPIRKPGKLPWAVIAEDYGLEYGTDRVEMHVDAIQPGTRVLLVDDVLATGGTLSAAIRLAQRAGGQVVGAAVLIDLTFLGGAQRLGVPLRRLLTY